MFCNFTFTPESLRIINSFIQFIRSLCHFWECCVEGRFEEGKVLRLLTKPLLLLHTTKDQNMHIMLIIFFFIYWKKKTIWKRSRCIWNQSDPLMSFFIKTALQIIQILLYHYSNYGGIRRLLMPSPKPINCTRSCSYFAPKYFYWRRAVRVRT